MNFQEIVSNSFSILNVFLFITHKALTLCAQILDTIKKLRNYKPDTWRYRIGDYRFFYEIDDKEKIVFMIAADNRGDAY